MIMILFFNFKEMYWIFGNQQWELDRMTVHIQGICINSVSVERLWSSMGFFHTNR